MTRSPFPSRLWVRPDLDGPVLVTIERDGRVLKDDREATADEVREAATVVRDVYPSNNLTFAAVAAFLDEKANAMEGAR